MPYLDQYCFYLEYNSTINCSFIFSGICILSGRATKLPSDLSEFQVSQSYALVFADRASTIIFKDFDFSLTATTSPGCRLEEGKFTNFPLTVICLCETNGLAELLEGETP